jgi:two-component sensor histidine kinase
MEHPRSFLAEVSLVLRQWWSWRYDENEQRWKYWLATFFYNSVFALALTVLFVAFNERATMANTVGETFVISHCIGFTIHSLYEIVARLSPRLIAHPTRWVRVGVHFAIPLFGALLGYIISFALFGQDFLSIIYRHPRLGLGLLVTALIVVAVFFFISDAQTHAAKAALHESALLAQTRAAELRALQAQIEPHFLFNTLANVQALIDYEPQKAKAILDAFVQHLRLSLSHSRAAHSTIGQEFALIETYLDILKIRLGARLRVQIEVERAVEKQPLSPLIVQPLVENAVKYGIEPNIDGGTIVVRAYSNSGKTYIEVCDDGPGLNTVTTARKGTGVGLQNVRERLHNTYGANAALTLEPLTPGTRALITLS